MVSDVICLPFFDRIWCILTTFFSLTVHQTNIRAFYSRLYGIAKPAMNEALLWIGFITCISFPLVGYFDEHNFPVVHVVVSTTFFVSTTIYGNLLSYTANKHKSQFKTDNCWISVVYWVGWFMIAMLLMFGISLIFDWWVPVWEWALGLSFTNFHTFIAFKNPYYDSVTPIKKDDPEPQPDDESEHSLASTMI